MKILTIVGARPQFIKAAMLSAQLSKHDFLQEVILHTGQHYDANMSDIFFEELGLPAPRYNLGIHKSTHGSMTGCMLVEIEKVLLHEKPNLVVVYGDTDSTLAGALAAAKLQIPIAHIEAGLRSFNRAMPEEINRVVTDHVSDLLFAPTPTAVKNLQNENLPEQSIILTGDIMFDAALHACKSTNEAEILKQYKVKSKKYILTTLHRAENTNTPDRLLTWLDALDCASREQKQTLLLPLHPRTKQRLLDFGKKTENYPSIQFMEPIGYKTMTTLIKHARLIVTDSGGLQKEAYFHKVPGLILRKQTEWVELLETGWSHLVDCKKSSILAALKNIPKATAWQQEVFGNGKAANQIAEAIITSISRLPPKNKANPEICNAEADI